MGAAKLIFNQEQQRTDNSEQCLELFNHNYSNGATMSLSSPIKNQPSGLHAMYGVQSVESRRSRKAKNPERYGVWNNFRWLSTTKEYHNVVLMERLKDEIMDPWRIRRRRKHHFNAACQKSIKQWIKFNLLDFELRSHSTYSSNLYPTTFSCPQVCKKSPWRKIINIKMAVAETEIYFEVWNS